MFALINSALKSGKDEGIRVEGRKGRNQKPHDTMNNRAPSSLSSTGTSTGDDDTSSFSVPRNVGPPIYSNRIRAKKIVITIQDAQRMLETRETELTSEIVHLARNAMKLFRDNKRSAAVRDMMKKKRLEIQAREISNQINALECQTEDINKALAMCNTLSTIQQGIDGARLHGNASSNGAVTELDRLLDRVQSELAAGSSNGTSQDDGRGRDEFDEAGLLRELMQESQVLVEATPVFEEYEACLPHHPEHSC